MDLHLRGLPKYVFVCCRSSYIDKVSGGGGTISTVSAHHGNVQNRRGCLAITGDRVNKNRRTEGMLIFLHDESQNTCTEGEAWAPLTTACSPDCGSKTLVRAELNESSVG